MLITIVTPFVAVPVFIVVPVFISIASPLLSLLARSTCIDVAHLSKNAHTTAAIINFVLLMLPTPPREATPNAPQTQVEVESPVCFGGNAFGANFNTSLISSLFDSFDEFVTTCTIVIDGADLFISKERMR